MDIPPRGINLHPSNYLPSSLKKTDWDVLIIGSGPVGRSLGARTAAAGLSTLIIEKELYGGDCPFWACIPSKALLRPGEALEVGRGMNGSKQMINSDKPVDVEGVFTRRDIFTNNWDDQFLVDVSNSQGCSIVRGKGALTGDKTVEISNVNGEKIELVAKHAVVLATGSDPILPQIPGLADVQPWSPRHATAANTVPEHLLILGGGVVGCELATAFSSYGSKVTIVSSGSSILPRFEPEAGKRVAASLKSKGVEILCGTTVKSFSKTSSGFTATLSTGASVSGTRVLVAAGRRPNTSDIGLEKVGVSSSELNKLPVDESLCVTSTGSRWLYAIGDTNNRNPLTHMGVYQGKMAALAIIAKAKENVDVKIEAWGKYAATADHETCTQVVVTDPNIASVGLTLAAAKKKGINAKEVAVLFMFPGAWVHAESNYDGWAQWVIDQDKGVLVGATIVGREAADLLHASTVAIVGKVPIEKLWHAVPSWPTMSEIYVELMRASGY